MTNADSKSTEHDQQNPIPTPNDRAEPPSNDIERSSGGENKREEESKSTFWERWGTISDIAMAMGAIGALCYTARLFSVAMDQTKLANDSFNAQIVRDSLNDISQRRRDSLALVSFKLENRAWIASDSIIYPQPITIKRPFFLRIGIRNIGRTPATIVDSRLGCSFFREFPRNPTYGRLEGRGPSRAILGPGQDLETQLGANLTIRVTEEEMKRLYGGEEAFYVFGFVKYSDVFNDMHTTQYCYVYSRADSAFVYAKDYNDMN